MSSYLKSYHIISSSKQFEAVASVDIKICKFETRILELGHMKDWMLRAKTRANASGVIFMLSRRRTDTSFWHLVSRLLVFGALALLTSCPLCSRSNLLIVF